MIKNFIAVAIVVALGACSSGSNDSNTSNNGGNQNPTNGGVQNPTNGGVQNPTNGGNQTPATPLPPVSTVPSPGNGALPTPGTKAGTYIGYIGGESGSNGVYVVRNDFSIQGLAIQSDGSAASRFGNLGPDDTFVGALRQYTHEANQPEGSTDGGGFGSVAFRQPVDVDINVNIVNGQTIEGTAPVAVALAYNTNPQVGASIASLQGNWAGFNRYNCNGDNTNTCTRLDTTLTFIGSSVSGATRLTGVDSTPIIEGTITDFNGAVLIDFEWGGLGFSGLVFFVPDGSDRIAFVGERPTDVAGQAETISGVLTRQP